MNQNKSDKNSIDDHLDHALKSWAQRKTADAEHLAGLNSQIQARLADHSGIVTSTLDMAENQSSASALRQGKWLTRIAISTAAMLFVGIGLYGFIVNKTDTPLVGQPGDPSVFDLVQSNPERQQQLLERFQEFYGDQLSWVADNNGDLKVELSEQDADDRLGFVAIRLSLISRPVNSKQDQSWTLLHTYNLLASQELLIEVPGRESDPVEFSLWAFPVDQNLINVDLRYRMNAPVQIEFETSNLIRFGKTDQLYSVVKNDIEYRLYQTASHLDQNQDFSQLMIHAVRGCP